MGVTLKSTPMVADVSVGRSHLSSVKRRRSDDLPVPESPISSSLNVACMSCSLM